MAETTDKEGMLLQNMQDAGCSNDMINRCITLVKTQQVSLSFVLLAKYRKTLLAQIHQKQKELDCLDYMVFALEYKQYETIRRILQ